MRKIIIFTLFAVLLTVLVVACSGKSVSLPPAMPEATATPLPTFTPTPTPVPTDTPAPTPTPEPAATEAAAPEAGATTSPASDAGIAIEKGKHGFTFKDLEYGYQLLLPGEDWIPFLPNQDDVEQTMAAAKDAMPSVDIDAITQMMEQAGAQFRLYAFYTAPESRDENFAANLNVITTELDKGYDMNVVAKINEEQLLQTFPGSEKIAEKQFTNSQGVRVGMLTIKNPLVAADGSDFPLAQTFIYSQTPDNVLISMTFSTTFEKYETMKPVVDEIANSITFIR